MNTYVVKYKNDDSIDNVTLKDFIEVVTKNKEIFFNRDLNNWNISEDNLNCFMKKYPKYNIVVNSKAPKIERYSHIGTTLKLKPYEYQREIIDFILSHNNTLLVAPCGCGNKNISC